MALRAVRPMLATSAAELPEGADWSYEVKWDGYRAVAVKDGAKVTLSSRNAKDLTREYPTVAAAVAALHAREAMLDGEIVAVDKRGRPTFQALHHHTTSGIQIVYYAFDLLHLDGRDLKDTPLDRRRAALKSVVAGTSVLLSDALPGTSSAIEHAVRRLGLEGVVAKRRSSTYQPGKRTDAWVKVKFNRRQEFVVGGFKPNGRNFDSLLVGYYGDDRKLYFAGKVRTGFTPPSRADVFRRIASDETPRCPFVNLPSSATSHWGEGITEEEMTKLRWVEPRHVVEVSFVEWTRDGSLRHAQFVGVREDKRPREVRRERS
jgi:bifunctional non-homologous end joining protein LigD